MRARKPYHSIARWVAVVVVGIAVVAGLAMLVVEVDSTRSPTVVISSDREAMKDWWAEAQPAVTDLQDALYDSESALRRSNGAALAGICQRMHDAAAVDLPAQLPAPDPKLTAELTAAAEDAHAASHMCLALLEQSSNSYDGEFSSNLSQAEKQLRAAMTLVNRTLSTQPRGTARGRQ